MSLVQPPEREGRLMARIAVYAAGLSVFLIAIYVVAMSFKTQPETAPAAPAKPPEVEPTVAFAMMDAKDGAGFGEDPSYSDAFRTVRAKPEAALGGLPLDHAAVVADPAKYRGMPVRARGVIVDLRSVRLRTPADGQADVFRGFLSDTDGSKAVAFDLIGAPDVVVHAKKDVLDVEGVFYRMVAYEAEQKPNQPPRIVSVPYMIATSVRQVGPAPPWHGLPTWLAATIGISGGVVIVVLAWRRATTREVPRTAAALRRQAIRLRDAAEADAARDSSQSPTGSNAPRA